MLDYLCNRLYTLPEKEVERYLSQLCQLVLLRPGSSLEKVMVDLCAQSLRIAVKASGGLWCTVPCCVERGGVAWHARASFGISRCASQSRRVAGCRVPVVWCVAL